MNFESVVDNDSNHDNSINRSNFNNQFLASRSQSTLRLFRDGAPTERGCFCCTIPGSDAQGSNETLCVKLGKH